MQFLDATKLPSTVIGGVAVIAHGFARFTADIDAAIVATPEDAGRLLRIARKSGFRPRTRDAVRFAEENLVLLLEHETSGVPVDLSFALQEFEREAAAQAVTREIGGVRIRVPPLTAVLVYKMVAGRTKDLEDVTALLSTGADFDARAVETILEEFDQLLDSDRTGEFRRLLERQGRRRR